MRRPTAFLLFALAGCAGRAPAPVATVQPQDYMMDCTAIMAEIASNNEKVKQLASEEGLKVAQNVAAGVAGLFVPVLWFGMDFQGTAGKETQALQSRQQYLSVLAQQKRCGTQPEPALSPAPPKQPKRVKPAPAAQAVQPTAEPAVVPAAASTEAPKQP